MTGRRLVFFYNDTATTEIYTLSLHDALPICAHNAHTRNPDEISLWLRRVGAAPSSISKSAGPDRKSTRLNSSHVEISYAVFCLKKKNRYKQSHSRITLFTHQNIISIVLVHSS